MVRGKLGPFASCDPNPNGNSFPVSVLQLFENLNFHTMVNGNFVARGKSVLTTFLLHFFFIF